MKHLIAILLLTASMNVLATNCTVHKHTYNDDYDITCD